jgi:hypothetical protein
MGDEEAKKSGQQGKYQMVGTHGYERHFGSLEEM